jgi:hypothetical protein
VRARATAAVAGGRVVGGGMADVEMAGGGRWIEVRDDLLFFSIFPFFSSFVDLSVGPNPPQLTMPHQ